MAKYDIGNQPHYGNGILYEAHSHIELPNDGKPNHRPSRGWIGLDDAGKAAVKEVQDAFAAKDAAKQAAKAAGMSPTAFQSAVDRAVAAALAQKAQKK